MSNLYCGGPKKVELWGLELVTVGVNASINALAPERYLKWHGALAGPSSPGGYKSKICQSVSPFICVCVSVLVCDIVRVQRPEDELIEPTKGELRWSGGRTGTVRVKNRPPQLFLKILTVGVSDPNCGGRTPTTPAANRTLPIDVILSLTHNATLNYQNVRFAPPTCATASSPSCE